MLTVCLKLETRQMKTIRRKALVQLAVGVCVLLIGFARWHRHSGSDQGTVSSKLQTRVFKQPLNFPAESHLIAQKEPARTAASQISDGIPRILHYVFKNEMAFEPYKPLIRTCLDRNPDWQVFLWRDSDSEKLVQQYYKNFADTYLSYRDRLEKSDAIRYMILHKFGGIYLDMDVQCLKPFDQLLQLRNHQSAHGVSAFLGEERREQTRILYGYSFCTMNSLMGSRPGHPFFRFAIDRMRSMPNVNHARISTGPDFLTHLYHSWVKCKECQTGNPVHVFPARLVSPLMDTAWVNWKEKCQQYFKVKPAENQNLVKENAWKALGCAELVAKGWRFDDTDNDTVATHQFLHLGYGNQIDRKTFHLLNEFPRIQTHVL